MTKSELKDFLVALTPPEGMDKPQLDAVINPMIDHGFKRVWESHFWSFRMRRTELATVASQPYVAMPKDFENGIHLAREGNSASFIRIVPANQFYDDHPYPEGSSAGLPKEGTLLYDPDWGEQKYRVYLNPVPSEVLTLPLLYLRVGDATQLGSMPGIFVDAVIDVIKAKMGYIANEAADASIEEARAKSGTFVMPPGRHNLESIQDLNSWGNAGGTTAVPYGYYG